MRVAIIPARGGSKRIPRKNIREFRGRPIIAWSLAAAHESNLFDRVIVSTDDEEIADVARAHGGEVPFLRSATTADDHATIADMLVEVLGVLPDTTQACCIYATAPFVAADDLRAGQAALAKGDFDVVLPVAAFEYPIWRSLTRDGAGRVELNFPENRDVRSQDLPPAYHDAGQWIWLEAAVFARTHTLLGDRTGSVLLPPGRVQDIDTEDDWRAAELKHAVIFG